MTQPEPAPSPYYPPQPQPHSHDKYVGAVIGVGVIALVVGAAIGYGFGVSIATRQSQSNTLEAVNVFRFPTSPVYYDSTLVYGAEFACTGSMRPAFDCGDFVLVYEPQEAAEIQIGDIVGYSIPVQYRDLCQGFAGATHRVVEVTFRHEDQQVLFHLKGDANVQRDPCSIPFSYIVFKVIGVLYHATA